MQPQIDYSEIPESAQSLPQEEWEPPVHKFFGKKGPNGKMEKEPIYVHQEYPRMMYALRDKKVIAKLVQSEMQREQLGDEWKLNPGECGLITAPSFEQNLALRAQEAEAKTKEIEAPRIGRPPKAA